MQYGCIQIVYMSAGRNKLVLKYTIPLKQVDRFDYVYSPTTCIEVFATDYCTKKKIYLRLNRELCLR